MSKIGLKPIKIPQDIKIFQEKSCVYIEGPLGKNKINVPNEFTLKFIKNQLKIIPNNSKNKNLWGTFRSLLNNNIKGVTQGYIVKLNLIGIGYRATLNEKNAQLELKLGYSHLIIINVPQDILIKVPKPSSIILKGINLTFLTEFAAKIRKYKKPEPYKGKGILYKGEKIKKKEGKKK